MTTFPVNPALSLKFMEIGIELKYINSDSIFGHAIRTAVVNGRVKGIINEIYEQSFDNRNMVSDIVGEKLLRKIEYLCSTSLY